jgi:hypothetical protein
MKLGEEEDRPILAGFARLLDRLGSFGTSRYRRSSTDTRNRSIFVPGEAGGRRLFC